MISLGEMLLDATDAQIVALACVILILFAAATIGLLRMRDTDETGK